MSKLLRGIHSISQDLRKYNFKGTYWKICLEGPLLGTSQSFESVMVKGDSKLTTFWNHYYEDQKSKIYHNLLTDHTQACTDRHTQTFSLERQEIKHVYTKTLYVCGIFSKFLLLLTPACRGQNSVPSPS